MNEKYSYVMFPDHPKANKDGYVYEHVVNAELKLGRMLKKGEVVHHADGNKKNNSAENLVVFSTNEDHSRFHRTGIMESNNDGTFKSPSLRCMSATVGTKYIKKCSNCGCDFLAYERDRKFCGLECMHGSQRRCHRPTMSELKEKLSELKSWEAVGRHYKVSGSAIRKWYPELIRQTP